MKKTMIALALFAGLSSAAIAQQNVSIVENQNYIEVSGYSKTEVAPDEIYISFQINENDNKGKVSVNDQEKNMIRALQKIGIDVEKQLSVKDMSSNFKKYVLKRTDIRMSRDYQLKVGDAQTAAAAFEALEGVNISNATITKAEYSKIDELVLENKVEAMKNARNKAEKLAGAVDQGIGKAIYIQDYERSYRPYSVNMLTKASYDMAAGAEMESLPSVEFEKITVESTVNVRFLLK